MALSEISILFFVVQRHGIKLVGDYNLTAGAKVSMDGCLSLCIGPVIRWQSVQGVPHLSPYVNWDWLQLPPQPSKNKGYR